MSKKKSFEELKERAKLALEIPRLREIARFAHGSQSGYDLPIMEKFGGKEAISCEYLVKLREAYLDKFIKLAGEPILGKDGKRTFEELEIRSQLALGNPKLREMATKTDKGPNEAKDEAVKNGFTEEEAKSYRYLIQIKRYYPGKFDGVFGKTRVDKQTVKKVRKSKKLKKKTLKERLEEHKQKGQEVVIRFKGRQKRYPWETEEFVERGKIEEVGDNYVMLIDGRGDPQTIHQENISRLLSMEEAAEEFRKFYKRKFGKDCPSDDPESIAWNKTIEERIEKRERIIKEAGKNRKKLDRAVQEIKSRHLSKEEIKELLGIKNPPRPKERKKSRQEKKLQRKLRSKKKLALQVEALKLFLKKEKLSDQRLIGIANRNIKRIEKEQLLEDKELPATIAFMAAGATENQEIIKELLDTINLNSELTSHLRLIKDRCLEILREKLSKEGRRKKWKKEAKRENLKTLQIILTPSLATAITGLISKQFLPFLPMAIVIFVGLGLIYLFVSDYYFYLLTGIVNYKQGYLPLN